jgi:excinuclease UvrABC ATPase subunit
MGHWAANVSSRRFGTGLTVIVIDLGPEGGHAGGKIVVTGTPEQVAACKASFTGRHLQARLRA